MPRPLRIEYAGAVYHVMARWNRGQSAATYFLAAIAQCWWKRNRRSIFMQMGYESRVNQAVRWVESSRAHEVPEIKKRLEGFASGMFYPLLAIGEPTLS